MIYTQVDEDDIPLLVQEVRHFGSDYEARLFDGRYMFVTKEYLEDKFNLSGKQFRKRVTREDIHSVITELIASTWESHEADREDVPHDNFEVHGS